jgi:hypothetical protein
MNDELLDVRLPHVGVIFVAHQVDVGHSNAVSENDDQVDLEKRK